MIVNFMECNSLKSILTGEFGIVYRGLLLPANDQSNKLPEPVAIKTLKGIIFWACIFVGGINLANTFLNDNYRSVLFR